MDNYEMISTREAAERLGVSRQRVDQLIALGAIEAIKIPIPGSKRHHVHIDAASVEERRKAAKAQRVGKSAAPKPITKRTAKPAADRVVVADPPPKRKRRRRARTAPAGYLTCVQVGKRLNVNPGTVRSWIDHGFLPGFKWTDESHRQYGQAEITIVKASDLDGFTPPTRADWARLRREQALKRAAKAPAAQPSESTRRGFWARLLGRS